MNLFRIIKKLLRKDDIPFIIVTKDDLEPIKTITRIQKRIDKHPYDPKKVWTGEELLQMIYKR